MTHLNLHNKSFVQKPSQLFSKTFGDLNFMSKSGGHFREICSKKSIKDRYRWQRLELKSSKGVILSLIW